MTSNDTNADKAKERAERERLERLKEELSRAFAAPDSSYAPLTAAEVIARNRA